MKLSQLKGARYAFICCLAAACPSLQAGEPDVSMLHVVVVQDKFGKQSYEIVHGTFIPEALLARTPGYKARPVTKEGRESKTWVILPRFFFRNPDPEPPPPPKSFEFPPAEIVPEFKPEPAVRAPVAAKLAKNIGKERGRHMVLNLIGAVVMLGAAILLLRYYLNNR